MSYAATMGARLQRFAGFGDASTASVNSSADAAFAELDQYGGATVAPSPLAATPADPTSTSVPSTTMAGSSTSGASMSISDSGGSSSDFNSWFPGFANQVIAAGTTIAVDAIGSQAPTYVPVPVAPPEQTVFGIPLSLLLLGGGAFLLFR